MTDIATIPGITPTSTGLVIDDDLPVEAWADYGARLATVEAGLMWAIGDWKVFGDQHFHDGPANVIAARLGLAERTVWNATSVCKRVPPGVRRPELSYKHHELVAAQPPEVQKAWLAMAVDEKLAVATLADRIREAARSSRELPHVGKSRRIPIRFNVTFGTTDVPEEVLQEGVHHAAQQLHAWLAERGYDTDIAEVL